MLFQWLEPQQNPLVKPFYKRFMAYSRPKKSDRIAVLRDDLSQEIIACARLRAIGHYTLLTGMLIHPKHRKKGLGHLLLQHMQVEMHSEQVFIFSLSTLADFYAQHHVIEITFAPNDIQQRFECYQNQGKELTLMMLKKP